MPDDATTSSNDTQSTTQAGSGDRPTSTSTEPQPAAAAQSTGFRFAPGENVPDWAIGKTAGEVVQIANQLHQELIRGTVSNTPQQAAAQTQYNAAAPQPALAPQPLPATTTPQMPTDEEWATQPQLAAQKYSEYMRVTQLDPTFNQQAIAIGQQARTLIELQDPEPFKKWGPEIDVLVNQLDPRYRSVDNIKKVVSMVKADHIDEIVDVRMKEAMTRAQEAGTLRSDTGGDGASIPAGVGVNFDEAGLPDNYRRMLERYRVTPAKLDEFLLSTDVRTKGISLQQAREDWLKAAKAGDVITEEAIRIGEM